MILNINTIHKINVYFLNYKNYNFELLKNHLIKIQYSKNKSLKKTNKTKNYLSVKHMYFLNNFIKKLKKTHIHKKFSYFLITQFKKAKKKLLNGLYLNKFYCFWPLFKKKFFTNFIKLRKFKKLKYSKQLFKIKIKKLIKKKRSSPAIKLKIFFKKNKKKNKNKSYFFNFHKRLIKIFWKAQEFFKLNFLPKKKYTTKKFENKFNYWYKKNKPQKKKFEWKLTSVINENFLFFSTSSLNKVFYCKLILKNGLSNLSESSTIKKNDIISFPINYVKYAFEFVVEKFKYIKKFKKKNYTLIKNKLSQWKNIKKKFIEEKKYNLNSFNTINSNFEFNIFSSQMCVIKNCFENNRFDNYNKRYNLEKITTYKLNV